MVVGENFPIEAQVSIALALAEKKFLSEDREAGIVAKKQICAFLEKIASTISRQTQKSVSVCVSTAGFPRHTVIQSIVRAISAKPAAENRPHRRRAEAVEDFAHHFFPEWILDDISRNRAEEISASPIVFLTKRLLDAVCAFAAPHHSMSLMTTTPASCSDECETLAFVVDVFLFLREYNDNDNDNDVHRNRKRGGGAGPVFLERFDSGKILLLELEHEILSLISFPIIGRTSFSEIPPPGMDVVERALFFHETFPKTFSRPDPQPPRPQLSDLASLWRGRRRQQRSARENESGEISPLLFEAVKASEMFFGQFDDVNDDDKDGCPNFSDNNDFRDRACILVGTLKKRSCGARCAAPFSVASLAVVEALEAILSVHIDEEDDLPPPPMELLRKKLEAAKEHLLSCVASTFIEDEGVCASPSTQPKMAILRPLLELVDICNVCVQDLEFGNAAAVHRVMGVAHEAAQLEDLFDCVSPAALETDWQIFSSTEFRRSKNIDSVLWFLDVCERLEKHRN